MKKILLFVAMALQIVMANAFEGNVEIDGINYYILTKAAYAEVVSKNSGYVGDVVIPETVEYDGVVCTVKKIGNRAFNCDTKLISVSIPNTVSEIGYEVFNTCSQLNTVYIPCSVKKMGSRAFYACKALDKVMTDDLKSWCEMEIEDDANPLQYADHFIVADEEVIDLVIPETITSIADRAFHGYKGLKSITIGNFVSYIGDYAFYGCTELKTAKTSGANLEIGNAAFYECTALTELTISDGVSKIGTNCFSGCVGITDLSIPNSVVVIDAKAFYGCNNLKTIKIGSGLEYIGINAFSKCTELTDLYCFAENPPTMGRIYPDNLNPFKYSYAEYATLHVPETSVSAYQNNKIWNIFGKIVALTSDETDIEYVKNNSNVSECVRYTLGGQVLKSAQKGINIIRMSDGTTKKVLNK
ncbi:MAG: leucine-rich repeat domain-containing protein [Bacteroidaceae bacterium]|nr:leucine-rich repeat domain-containing protein [Bacteroidaceae bacterium]